MATLWIREYDRLSAGVHDTGGPAMQASMPLEPGRDLTPITFGASPLNSDPFTGRYIAICADAAFHYRVGADADTSAIRIPANALLFVGVHAGDLLSVIAAA